MNDDRAADDDNDDGTRAPYQGTSNDTSDNNQSNNAASACNSEHNDCCSNRNKSRAEDFEFIETIGEGSYGVVYRVRRNSMYDSGGGVVAWMLICYYR